MQLHASGCGVRQRVVARELSPALPRSTGPSSSRQVAHKPNNHKASATRQQGGPSKEAGGAGDPDDDAFDPRSAGIQAYLASKGLGSIPAFREVAEEELQRTLTELEEADLTALEARVAATGSDLEADWAELEGARSTTGQAKAGGGRVGGGSGTMLPEDTLLVPPSNPRIDRLRAETKQMRRQRRLFARGVDDADGSLYDDRSSSSGSDDEGSVGYGYEESRQGRSLYGTPAGPSGASLAARPFPMMPNELKDMSTTNEMDELLDKLYNDELQPPTRGRPTAAANGNAGDDDRYDDDGYDMYGNRRPGFKSQQELDDEYSDSVVRALRSALSGTGPKEQLTAKPQRPGTPQQAQQRQNRDPPAAAAAAAGASTSRLWPSSSGAADSNYDSLMEILQSFGDELEAAAAEEEEEREAGGRRGGGAGGGGGSGGSKPRPVTTTSLLRDVDWGDVEAGAGAAAAAQRPQLMGRPSAGGGGVAAGAGRVTGGGGVGGGDLGALADDDARFLEELLSDEDLFATAATSGPASSPQTSRALSTANRRASGPSLNDDGDDEDYEDLEDLDFTSPSSLSTAPSPPRPTLQSKPVPRSRTTAPPPAAAAAGINRSGGGSSPDMGALSMAGAGGKVSRPNVQSQRDFADLLNEDWDAEDTDDVLPYGSGTAAGQRPSPAVTPQLLGKPTAKRPGTADDDRTSSTGASGRDGDANSGRNTRAAAAAAAGGGGRTGAARLSHRDLDDMLTGLSDDDDDEEEDWEVDGGVIDDDSDKVPIVPLAKPTRRTADTKVPETRAPAATPAAVKESVSEARAEVAAATAAAAAKAAALAADPATAAMLARIEGKTQLSAPPPRPHSGRGAAEATKAAPTRRTPPPPPPPHAPPSTTTTPQLSKSAASDAGIPAATDRRHTPIESDVKSTAKESLKKPIAGAGAPSPSLIDTSGVSSILAEDSLPAGGRTDERTPGAAVLSLGVSAEEAAQVAAAAAAKLKALQSSVKGLGRGRWDSTVVNSPAHDAAARPPPRPAAPRRTAAASTASQREAEEVRQSSGAAGMVGEEGVAYGGVGREKAVERGIDVAAAACPPAAVAAAANASTADGKPHAPPAAAARMSAEEAAQAASAAAAKLRELDQALRKRREPRAEADADVPSGTRTTAADGAVLAPPQRTAPSTLTSSSSSAGSRTAAAAAGPGPGSDTRPAPRPGPPSAVRGLAAARGGGRGRGRGRGRDAGGSTKADVAIGQGEVQSGAVSERRMPTRAPAVVRPWRPGRARLSPLPPYPAADADAAAAVFPPVPDDADEEEFTYGTYVPYDKNDKYGGYISHDNDFINFDMYGRYDAARDTLALEWDELMKAGWEEAPGTTNPPDASAPSVDALTASGPATALDPALDPASRSSSAPTSPSAPSAAPAAEQTAAGAPSVRPIVMALNLWSAQESGYQRAATTTGSPSTHPPTERSKGQKQRSQQKQIRQPLRQGQQVRQLASAATAPAAASRVPPSSAHATPHGVQSGPPHQPGDWRQRPLRDARVGGGGGASGSSDSRPPRTWRAAGTAEGGVGSAVEELAALMAFYEEDAGHDKSDGATPIPPTTTSTPPITTKDASSAPLTSQSSSDTAPQDDPEPPLNSTDCRELRILRSMIARGQPTLGYVVRYDAATTTAFVDFPNLGKLGVAQPVAMRPEHLQGREHRSGWVESAQGGEGGGEAGGEGGGEEGEEGGGTSGRKVKGAEPGWLKRRIIWAVMTRIVSLGEGREGESCDGQSRAEGAQVETEGRVSGDEPAASSDRSGVGAAAATADTGVGAARGGKLVVAVEAVEVLTRFAMPPYLVRPPSDTRAMAKLERVVRDNKGKTVQAHVVTLSPRGAYCQLAARLSGANEAAQSLLCFLPYEAMARPLAEIWAASVAADQVNRRHVVLPNSLQHSKPEQPTPSPPSPSPSGSPSASSSSPALLVSKGDFIEALVADCFVVHMPTGLAVMARLIQTPWTPSPELRAAQALPFVPEPAR